jgi:hypothetical protein
MRSKTTSDDLIAKALMHVDDEVPNYSEGKVSRRNGSLKKSTRYVIVSLTNHHCSASHGIEYTYTRGTTACATVP